MRRSVWLWAALFVLALGGSAFAYVWFSGGSGEPSTELTTPEIVAETTTSIFEESSTTEGESTTTTPEEETGAFVIQAELSEASFTLNEVLRGSPKTVVGTTSEVAGQFLLDPDDLGSATFSQIVINARTFQTDSGTRDRAIRGPIILNSASDEFEFITFDVTSIEGLDRSATVGETLEFVIVGDLTIRGVTQQASFDVSATLNDDSTVAGTAVTEVLRSDFEIGIPSVASVADVTDEVEIRLDFVATRS